MDDNIAVASIWAPQQEFCLAPLYEYAEVDPHTLAMIAELENKVKLVENEKQSLVVQLTTSQNDVRTLQVELTRLADVMRELEDHKNELARLRQSRTTPYEELYASLQKEFEAYKHAQIAAGGESQARAQAHTENASLREQLAKERATIQQLQTSHEEAAQRFHEQCCQWQAAYEHKESELVAATENAAVQSSSSSHYQAQLSNTLQELEIVRKKLESTTNSNTSLQQEIQLLTQARQEDAEKILSLDSSLKLYQEAAAIKSQEEVAAAATADAVRNEHSSTVQRLEEENAALTAQVQVLSSQIVDLQNSKAKRPREEDDEDAANGRQTKTKKESDATEEEDAKTRRRSTRAAADADSEDDKPLWDSIGKEEGKTDDVGVRRTRARQ